jgi:ribosome-binding protein aMBF1 (putative translation factor)
MSRSRQQNKALTALGLTVRELREARGMTVADLAAKMDMRSARIQALEDGRVDPQIDAWFALAAALGVRAGELAGLAEARESQL